MFSSWAPPAAADAGLRARARRFLRRIRVRSALCVGWLVALLAIATGTAPRAHAQFVQGGALVPGPSAADFTLWGTIASPTTGVLKVDDGFDFASGGNAGANFARVWIGVGTQLGGSSPVSPSDTVQYVYIRMDHKGVAEEATNFNMQLNLGGAPAGRVDHLLSLRPVFSGPNKPLTGRVRIALRQYATDASGNFPLLGAFTTSSFVSSSVIDNVGATADGTAIGWDAVATDGRNGFEVRIPAGWFHGDPTRLVQPDGSGARSVIAAVFSSGGSFGAVATVLDKLGDASGNNVLINLSTTTGAHTTIVGTQLAYGTQPAAANAGATLGAFTVKQLNADATTVAGGTGSISLAIASGPAGGVMSGTTTRTASSGVATFNDISFSVPGTYTLTATSTGLLSATSSSFTISATTPAAPTITSITSGNTQLSAAFTAPTSDGGSTITTYQYSTNNGSSWTTRATGTTGSPLLITGLTNGTTYTVRVRAVNGVGNGIQSNSMTGMPEAPGPPSNSVAPAITGATTVGQTLTTTTGTWGGSPAPTYTYQWQRCDTAGANCANIAGATSNQYALVSADTGSTLRAVVTGTNTYGSVSATSARSAVVAALPANTVAPSITGTTESGQLLTAATGTWTGTPSPTYTYQWQRCDTSGANCSSITSATASTYTLTGADVGATVRVAVTGTNTAGNATATAAPTATITPAPAPPVNTVAPAISGPAIAGQTLNATPGTWTGYPTPTIGYQWRRCDGSGNGCADIAGETASSYTLTPSDTGATMRVSETATNSMGSASAPSSPSAVVAATPVPPGNSAVPTISGTTTVGQLLTANTGTWTGTPAPTIVAEWQRCDLAGGNCASIAGASASTYALVAADAGSTIRVVETGTNGFGSASATSAATAAVNESPANTVAPVVSGITMEGQTLAVSQGTWTGYPVPALGYQWERCNALGTLCASIAGATSSSYVLVTDDVGATVRAVVTGTNAVGAVDASSAPSAVIAVAGVAPSNSAPPTMSGTTTVGQVLTATDGTWSGTPAPSLTYQWQRCDASGANCTDITGATANVYTLGDGDVGSTIRVNVTGSNTLGASTGSSVQTAAVAPTEAAPVLLTPPTISGTVGIGKPLVVTTGTFGGTPTPVITSQWQRCDAAGNNCIDIAGETGTTYLPTAADEEMTIRVKTTGTNSSGSASGTSSVTIAVPVLTLPTVSGAPQVGIVLTAAPGNWPEPSTVAYQWQRCDASGANCTEIPGATGQSYTPDSTDIGFTVQVIVAATSSGATKTARTAPVARAKAMAGSSKVYAPAFGGMATRPAGIASADSTPADGTRFALVRVELLDAAGRAVAGRASSEFTISINGVAVATPVRETTTPGTYELEVRSTTVNQAMIAITIDGVRLQQQATVQFVAATANLDIALSASSETPAIGQTVVFTIVVKNPGPDAATGVEVEHKPSERVRYVSSEATRGEYDPTRGIWRIGEVALGESVSLKVTVTVIK